jgi:uncharacterized protein
MVAATSLAIARRWNEHHPDQQVDTQFIYEAAMLHDIGIYAVHAPAMWCIGEKTYIEHGYIGYLLLLDHNLPSHARVALTHTGVGIQKQEIIDNWLPLPVDLDYTPMSIEEKIISYADLYYSKSRYNQLLVAKTPAQARASVAKFGEAQGVIFDEWFALFE